MNTNLDLSLYLVTDRKCLRGRDLLDAVNEAILGGVTLVQLREKDINAKDYYELALKLKKITDKYNIPLIIDDRVDVAIAIDAAGVHVGQDDLPCNIVRKMLGPDKIIGVSAHNLQEALKAQCDGASYLGCGSVFNTSTKKNVINLSKEELSRIKQNVDIPVCAIGGINQNNISKLIGTNIDGIAIVSAILEKNDIKNAAKNLKIKF